ncbi:MAG: O-antigen ligase family protein [Planctomycetes bacterium]|nr:O-antigen ligase family protein [Planctomycetota bacterium]
MTKTFEQVKTARWRTFEFVLLIIVLCVLAIRATYPESPNTTSIISGPALSNAAFSLIITSLLVFCFAAWLIFAFIKGKVRYRFNWIEVGTFIFIAAGIAAVFAASNKRFAITELVTIAGPMLAAVMLVQILDNDIRIKLVLMTIVACAAVSTYKCSEDFFTYNQMMIDQYEADPAAQLAQMRIEEGTFQHFSYEHRLYSKDVRGFLTTGNSVASFMTMAIFASLALFWKKISAGRLSFIIAAILTAAICFTLLLTHSKGGIAALIVALSMLCAYLLFAKLIKRFRIPIIILCVLAAASLTAVTVKYGMQHNRLPGGNSMLVRWQYWSGAMKIYALEPLTGVGGGNFANHYTQFKQPQALESVKDPHNFLLSILSQYGPFALLGLCGAFLLPMTRNIFSTPPDDCVITDSSCFKKRTFAAAAAIFIAMLLFRPILMKVNYDNSDAFTIFVTFLILFAAPALFFLIPYMAMIRTEYRLKETRLSEKTGALLFCAIAAVALHNLIDFAFFEPAISTIFWTLTACMVAWQLNKNKQTAAIFQIDKIFRIGAACLTIACTWAFVHFAVTPPVRASLLHEQVNQMLNRPILDPYTIHQKLSAAAKADPLSTDAPVLHGNILLQQFQTGNAKTPGILHQAVERFTEAAKRDEANYSYYEKLSTAHDLLASQETGRPAKANKEKAAYWMDESIKRYPNSARLHIKAAILAESNEKIAKALQHYKKAIDIEDDYRKIFKVMYPEREIFSRLGEDKYQQAKQKVKQFSN